MAGAPRGKSWYRWDGADLILEIYAQPRASLEGFAGISEHGLKVRLTAAPVEGEANSALQRWLACQFGVSKGEIVLEQGQTGRRKRVRVCSPRRLPTELEIKKP